MKLMTLTIIMICLSTSILIFDNTATITPESGTVDFYGTTNSTDLSEDSVTTKIWSFFKAPEDWQSTDSIIYWLIKILALGLGALGIYALVTKSFAPDTYVFAAWFAGLLGFGAIPVFQLYNFLGNRLTPLMCSGIATDGFCFMPTIIAIIFAGGLGFIWVIKCINHWRTGSD